MTSHYTSESVTTLHGFGGVLGRPLDTLFWALTISWKRLLARVWSGPKEVLQLHTTNLKTSSSASNQWCPWTACFCCAWYVDAKLLGQYLFHWISCTLITKEWNSCHFIIDKVFKWWSRSSLEPSWGVVYIMDHKVVPCQMEFFSRSHFMARLLWSKSMKIAHSKVFRTLTKCKSNVDQEEWPCTKSGFVDFSSYVQKRQFWDVFLCLSFPPHSSKL